MRVLGVSGTEGALFLSVADNGDAVDAQPEKIAVPNLLRLPSDLEGLRGELDRAVAALHPERIDILAAGVAPQSYKQACARVGAETVLRLVAVDRSINCSIVTRQRCGKKLGATGQVTRDNVDDLVPRQGRYWSAGRSLAVATAIAGSS